MPLKLELPFQSATDQGSSAGNVGDASHYLAIGKDGRNQAWLFRLCSWKVVQPSLRSNVNSSAGTSILVLQNLVPTRGDAMMKTCTALAAAAVISVAAI